MRKNFEMEKIGKACVWILIPVVIGTSSALIWPWSFFFPGSTTPTATVGAGTISYGFLRPSIIVPAPTTTTAATTTTTTTPSPTQLFINALLASSIPVANNSPLINFANALANRPVFGGLARPYPVIIGGGGGGILPVNGAAGGVAVPGQLPASVGGVASPIGGGFVLPPGFPAGGGVAASGVLPGFFPGAIGRSSKGGGEVLKSSAKPSTGRVVFASKK